MESGFHDVTYTSSETIGLPNWSQIQIFAAAKTTVPLEHFDSTFDYLFLVVNTFIKERCEKITRAMNMWSGDTQTLDQGTKDGIVPQGIPITSTELTFTMKERVGQPNKSSVEIFAAVKGLASPGAEFQGLEALASKLSAQMAMKRDIVIANRRPWTVQNG